MNPAAPLSPPPPRSRTIWRVLLIGTAVCFVGTAWAVYHTVTPTKDNRLLRDELVSQLHAAPSTQIQITAGPLLLSTARTVLGFLDDIPSEARLAMRAVRQASVGVYLLDAEMKKTGRAGFFTSADEVMRRRGWTRIVGVNDEESVVLIYVPDDEPSGSSERVCVAVCSQKTLVIVSGTIQIAPLVDLAVQKGVLAQR
jgi:hypothetical protein